MVIREAFPNNQSLSLPEFACRFDLATHVKLFRGWRARGAALAAGWSRKGFFGFVGGCASSQPLEFCTGYIKTRLSLFYVSSTLGGSAALATDCEFGDTTPAARPDVAPLLRRFDEDFDWVGLDWQPLPLLSEFLAF